MNISVETVERQTSTSKNKFIVHINPDTVEEVAEMEAAVTRWPETIKKFICTRMMYKIVLESDE